MTTSDFEHYAANFKEQLACEQERLNANTPLRELEALTVKLAFLLESGWTVREPQTIRWACNILMAKLVNELLAFTGAIRANSLRGAQPHIRTMLEVKAAAHYLFEDQRLVPRRVHQLLEFAEMTPWLMRKPLEKLLAAGSITQAEFDERNHVTDELMATFTPAKVQEWITLFGAKNEKELARRRDWHVGLEKQVAALDPHGRNTVFYGMLCHTTHVSPVGHRLADPTKLVGQDPTRVTQAIFWMFQEAWGVLQELDKAEVCGTFTVLAPEIDQLLAAFGNHLPGPESSA